MSFPRLSAGLIAATLLCAPAMAQTVSAQTVPAQTVPTQPAAPNAAAPAPGTAAPGAATATQPAGDPLLARVNGQPIHMSDVNNAMSGLPEQARSMPPQMLYPMVLNQLIDRQALAAEARKQGLENDPAVQAAIVQATNQALQNGLLRRDIAPTITDAALQARYERDDKNKPGEPELHARHILVATEDEAKQIIAQLQKGGDFAAIAKQHSTEPGAAQSGGDLGWFKKGDMLPEFSAAAFATKPGQIDPNPVHTQYGWHVIQVLEARVAPPQTFDQAKDEIRQQLIQEGIQKAVTQARADAKVERFNPDGTAQRPTDLAVPPPPASR